MKTHIYRNIQDTLTNSWSKRTLCGCEVNKHELFVSVHVYTQCEPDTFENADVCQQCLHVLEECIPKNVTLTKEQIADCSLKLAEVIIAHNNQKISWEQIYNYLTSKCQFDIGSNWLVVRNQLQWYISENHISRDNEDLKKEAYFVHITV